MSIRVLLSLALLVPLVVGGQASRPAPRQAPSAGQARALPVSHASRTTATIQLDGHLDESAWAAAEPTTSFTQVDPEEGAPASQRTEARVLYDDTYLYVGVRLFDTGAITGRLGRRGGLGRLGRLGRVKPLAAHAHRLQRSHSHR